MTLLTYSTFPCPGLLQLLESRLGPLRDILEMGDTFAMIDLLERGRLTQLVEYLVYTEAVGGSSPSPPIQDFLGVFPLLDRRHLRVSVLA